VSLDIIFGIATGYELDIRRVEVRDPVAPKSCRNRFRGSSSARMYTSAHPHILMLLWRSKHKDKMDVISPLARNPKCDESSLRLVSNNRIVSLSGYIEAYFMEILHDAKFGWS
jgi:hypothetical protein